MRFVVSGGRPLRGVLRVGPAKNALLPELAAALLTEDEVCLRPAARMRDVDAMIELLRAVGASVTWQQDDLEGMLCVQATGRLTANPPAEVVGRMRASVLVMGPLLTRCGRVRLATPGGCAIGERPIDLHLQAMRALGADVLEGRDWVEVIARRGLRGGQVVLPFPSHTATENAMLAAATARGDTVIIGAALEPEIVDLATLLNSMGADITGAGQRVIRIHGCSPLHGARHRPIADRIEAGTYLLAAAVTGGDLRVDGVPPAHMGGLMAKLGAAGFSLAAVGDGTNLAAADNSPKAVDVRTQPYPGFPTDLQPQFCVLAAIARGVTFVHETIFTNRLNHLVDLCRMGARATTYGPRFARIAGPATLIGTRVTAADLRGGAALVLAGLAAEGETIVEGADHVARGYTDLAGTLRELGARIHTEGEAPLEPSATTASAATIGGHP